MQIQETTMTPGEYPLIFSLEELSPAHGRTIAAAIAALGNRLDGDSIALAYGLAAPPLEEALDAGEGEIARLEATPTATPREDLAGAVALAYGIRAAIEVWRPAAIRVCYERADQGDENARTILERYAGVPWSEIRAFVRGE
ncbi:MAG: hypothetical protein ABFC89_01375 [Methanospirillum sp.]